MATSKPLGTGTPWTTRTTGNDGPHMTARPQEIGTGKRLAAPVEAAYLTPAEVATLLRLSAKSIYRLAKVDSTMPMLKIAGTVRFPRERLERWLRSREQGPPMRRRVHLVTKSTGSAAGPAPCADPCADGARQ
jgi:excisionase family DNA binding protein